MQKDDFSHKYYIDQDVDCNHISLSEFIIKSFQELNPSLEYQHNWHIDSISYKLEQIYKGNIKRFIISMPPRYMKSLCISIAFPAWVLGLDPSKKIICVSYSQLIANKFSADTRKIINSKWYKEIFPNTRLRRGENQKFRFSTYQNGFRFASSIGGSLTGEGADLIIIDDPHKPNEVESRKARERVIDWYEKTLVSRLNDKKNGTIILVMQRLHKEDLTGYLLNKDGYWDCLKFEGISQQIQSIDTGKYRFIRQVGEPLHKQREGNKELEQIKREIGEYAFLAQYQQNPVSLEGNLLKRTWLNYYTESPRGDKTYFLSFDTAMKSGFLNDFTSISIWCIMEGDENNCYLEECINERLIYPDLLDKTLELIDKYKPITLIIEDKGSGIGLIQDLNNRNIHNIYSYKPSANKIVRFAAASVYFRDGLIHLNTNMKSRVEVEEQLLSFPNCQHDDICDSIAGFLNFYYSYRISNKVNKSHIRMRNL